VKNFRASPFNKMRPLLSRLISLDSTTFKNKKYAETVLHFQVSTMPDDFKGDSMSKKLTEGLPLYNWARENKFQLLFFSNLYTKIALFVYGEYTKWRKSIKIEHISVNKKTT
jgi:hypothetical protein